MFAYVECDMLTHPVKSKDGINSIETNKHLIDRMRLNSIRCECITLWYKYSLHVVNVSIRQYSSETFV